MILLVFRRNPGRHSTFVNLFTNQMVLAALRYQIFARGIVVLVSTHVCCHRLSDSERTGFESVTPTTYSPFHVWRGSKVLIIFLPACRS
jgi:hypothetical protein